MKLTNFLLKQHNGWLAKLKWKYQGKRNVFDTGVITSLQNRGIAVVDAIDYVKNNNRNFDSYYVQQENVIRDNQFPSSYVFSDSNVLVYGTKQAQVLTKSIMLNELPENIERKFETLKLPTDIERSMHQSVLVSHLLDAEQKKSSIRVPLRPDKPKHIIRKEYNITDNRKNSLMATRLINHCERFFGHTESLKKRVINDVKFMVPIVKNRDDIQFNLNAETFIATKKPIEPFSIAGNANITVPDISPLSQSISIPFEENVERKYSYPIKMGSSFSHPHTVLLHYSNLDVKNLFEEPITNDQFESRAIIKGFTVAASRAKTIYGDDVKSLQEPITVQVVQLDGKRVQFGIFQLNTLDLDDINGPTNYWFRKPEMLLYDECIYKEGRPLLTNYNFDVFKLMSIFYSN